jgi:P4 family phage/plasmid primase-like protien
MVIPEKLQGLNFVLIGGDGKQPIEKQWQKKIHKIDCPIFQKHLSEGKNYGIQMNNSFIQYEGDLKFLIVVDFDNKEFQDKVLPLLPETFTTTSGSSKNCYHLWFASDNNKAFKVKDEQLNTLADILGEGNQVIAPGSIHKSGSTYSVVKDIPLVYIPYSEIEAIFKPLDRSPRKVSKPKKQFVPKGISNDIGEEVINSISMEDVLSEVGVDTSKNPTNCFAHSSVGGKCFGFDDEKAHCFHCDGSWNKFSLIREAKNLTDKETFEWFAEKSGKLEELKQARKEYVNKNKTQNIGQASKVFTPQGQAKVFNDIQPLFYDKHGLWWLWNSLETKWEIVDEVDILNMIADSTGDDIVSPKNRTVILNSLKQQGRKMMPKPIQPTWIQFKDKIMDIKTGEKFDASPQYFVTNPLPWKLNADNLESTPNMDRVFEEWVGNENVRQLYEILAYCMMPDYPINRLFCFIGSGMNGKSKFLELLRNFVGGENCCTTELDTLLTSRFEITRLHKKLVCMMGETNFNEMSKTSILKKLTGGDLIGFEYKNKNPFDEKNYAKIIIATNNLPTTTDKTEGFYRRWMIIDFPNKFSEKKDILAEIPEEEYGCLALKCSFILKELIENRAFTNEGSVEDRKEKYESKSNFIETFLREATTSDVNGYITSADFFKRFSSWCKENRHREMSETSVGIAMKKAGMEQEKKYFNWLFDGKGGQLRCWTGIKWVN